MTGHRVTWFDPPDRPVEGNTIYVRPARREDHVMFERFTDRSRRAVILAEEAARVAQHDAIHTAHLLAGLLHEGEGVAAQVLTAAGLDIDTVRERAITPIPSRSNPVTGHIPFTQATKLVLEYALREALQLGCNYVGTEHLLLGFLRCQELHGDGLLDQLGLDAGGLRSATLRRLVDQQAKDRKPREHHVIVGDHVEPVRGALLLNVHPAADCEGRPCVVHAPSDHPLASWPLHWRQDRGLFERLCLHGIGHPDPDQRTRWVEVLDAEGAAAEAVHGCDGCCGGADAVMAGGAR